MQLSPAQIQDDALFWLNQDREHNLFFEMGFLDAALKAQAAKLYAAYDQALKAGDLAAALALVPQSQTFKRAALAATQPQRGWIWPSFIEHTGREIDTMLARTQRAGGISSRDEICLGDRMLAEHAAFAAHLLDPVAEVALSKLAQEASDKTFGVVNRCMTDTLETLVGLSRQVGTELDAFVKGPLSTAKSNIHPVLADHVKREGERFLGMLPMLPQDEQMPPPAPVPGLMFGR